MKYAIALYALLLTACGQSPVKVQGEEYEPPRVDCQQQRTADAPAWPLLWFLDGPSFAIEVLGLVAEERTLRAAEQRCITRLKEAGVIR